MNKHLKKYLFALLATLVIFNSCKKEYETIASVDENKIQAYIKQNNLNVTKDPSGYYYNVIDKGAGSTIKNSDSIFYSYTFKTLEGKVLTQTTDLSIPAELLGYSDRFVIEGSSYLFTPFREVLTLLNRGGKATIIIPSSMAFGKNGLSSLGIGSNEILVVDLAIYSFSKKHEADDFAIKAFITKNNLNLTKSNTLYYNVITPGTGTDAILLSSTIKANYVLRSLDGTEIQKVTDGTFSGEMLNLFKGWQLALPGRLTKGGKMRLVFPSALGDIPMPLDFDIEILEVTN